MRSPILLRKIAGVLTACRRNRTIITLFPRFGAPSLFGVLALFLGVIIRPLLLLLLLALILHAPHHAVPLAGLGVVGTTEVASNAIVEKRNEFTAKQKELAEIFTLAKDGSTHDFTRKSVLEKLGATDESDALAKIRNRNDELAIIGGALQAAEIKAIEQANNDRAADLSRPSTAVRHPGSGRELEVKSLGELTVESKQYREDFLKGPGRNAGVSIMVDMGIKAFLDGIEGKTLLQTTAGFAPQSVRTGLLVEAVTRPIQVLDLIPTRTIAQALDKYMEETTRTHASAEKAEGGTYAESTFVWTERSNPVQKITDSIPVTDEQIEDAPEVAGILDQRMRFGVRQRLDQQVLVGNGTPPNLKGVLNVSGIQTQAKAADPVFDAIFKAMTLIRFTGRANPGAIAIHPTDWQNVRLTRSSTGEYIMGNPATVGANTLFGLPVAITDVLTLGTALVGDFTNFSYIGERRGINIEIGLSGTQFVEGKKTIRADLRAVFTVTRPAAFATVTGL